MSYCNQCGTRIASRVDGGFDHYFRPMASATATAQATGRVAAPAPPSADTGTRLMTATVPLDGLLRVPAPRGARRLDDSVARYQRPRPRPVGNGVLIGLALLVMVTLGVFGAVLLGGGSHSSPPPPSVGSSVTGSPTSAASANAAAGPSSGPSALAPSASAPDAPAYPSTAPDPSTPSSRTPNPAPTTHRPTPAPTHHHHHDG